MQIHSKRTPRPLTLTLLTCAEPPLEHTHVLLKTQFSISLVVTHLDSALKLASLFDTLWTVSITGLDGCQNKDIHFCLFVCF